MSISVQLLAIVISLFAITLGLGQIADALEAIAKGAGA